ncbi:MAG TPA: hypothetical protein ENK18_01440 [Deltaproteobacteria bacterium]|nr:hypothetical protein [Deltaproteobacteria bacterium]
MSRRRARSTRRSGSGAALQGARPGAEKAKSLAKALGPEGARSLKQARELAAAGNVPQAAEIIRGLAARLAEEGKPALAARGMARLARTLYKADRQEAAEQAVREAVGYAKGTGDRRALKAQLRGLVQRVRSRKGDEVADRLQGVILEGLGLSKLR